MQLVLKCRDRYGSIAFPEEMIDDAPVGERHYQISNFLVTLEGYRDAVLHHDAAQLLAQGDGLFRMLTPAEQDQFSQAKQAASTVQESAPAASPVVVPEQKPDDGQPPALLDKIKKVSAGG